MTMPANLPTEKRAKRGLHTSMRPRPSMPAPLGVSLLFNDPVLFLLGSVVFLIPLIPRPTLGGAVQMIAPLVVITIGYLALLIHLDNRGNQRPLLTTTPFIAAILGTLVYASRTVFRIEHGELTHVISRILLVLLAATVCLVMDREILDYLLEKFSTGFILLAGIAAIVAVTGLDILVPTRAPRTLGITFPWFKTTGIPRSFGEQALILAVALAYLLAYWHRMGKRRRVLLTSACIIIVAVGQSRNIYITAAAVIAMWYLAVRPRRYTLVGVGILSCGLATFLVQQAFPLLVDTEIGRSIIGEGILQRNITARFSLVNEAMELVDKNEWQALIGWSHQDWLTTIVNAQDATIHNFFFSSVVFLGLIGSGFTIWAFFVRPLPRCIRLYRLRKGTASTPQTSFLLVAASGTLVSLNFYEGFFSLTLGFIVGVAWYLASQEFDTWKNRVHDTS